MHFIQCTAIHLQAGHIKRRGEFKKTHGKLCTSKVIYESFMRIFISLRCEDAPPSNVTYFESDIDKMVQNTWIEQRAIEWDQILKGRIRKFWGIAQGIFYQNIPETGGKVHYSASLWAAATVQSLLDFSLHLWNDICDSMHGVDEEDTKRIIKECLIKRVDDLYGKKGEVEQEYSYLFRDELVSLRQRLTQYLIKWVASIRMAENVIAPGKLRDKGGDKVELRRGRRGKGKKVRARDVIFHRGGTERGIVEHSRPTWS